MESLDDSWADSYMTHTMGNIVREAQVLIKGAEEEDMRDA